MYRYRVHLFAVNFPWEWVKVDCQIIALFKPDQNLNKDLSHIFSNFNEIDEDFKPYASSVADDLFTKEELNELVRFFVDKKGFEIMIGKRIEMPHDYNNSGGISVVPLDSRREHISFEGAEKLSFPMKGFIEYENHYISPYTIKDVLEEPSLTEKQLREKLSNL